MSNKTISPFDMTLRFWSDGVPLDDIVARLEMPVKHLHVKGTPIAGKPPIAGRLAKSHYASAANEKAMTFAESLEWLRKTARKVEADDALVRLLATRQVAALFWITMFGPDPVPTPFVDDDLVALVVRVHARVVVENYTDDGPSCPTKTWFPETESGSRPQ